MSLPGSAVRSAKTPSQAKASQPEHIIRVKGYLSTSNIAMTISDDILSAVAEQVQKHK